MPLIGPIESHMDADATEGGVSQAETEQRGATLPSKLFLRGCMKIFDKSYSPWGKYIFLRGVSADDDVNRIVETATKTRQTRAREASFKIETLAPAQKLDATTRGADVLP